MSPVRAEDFVYLEVAVPRDRTGGDWRNALTHVTNAEKAFALGDDAAVFRHLRGALDALPGAKQHIFDALPEPKRERINSLARDVGQFLHLGRHVSDAGKEAGVFPVDHLDAEYALAQMRVLMSYASRLLSRSTA